jgi:hypothetical protein
MSSFRHLLTTTRHQRRERMASDTPSYSYDTSGGSCPMRHVLPRLEIGDER